jgi:TetR/AcrR family transcriptional repressor of bet genes
MPKLVNHDLRRGDIARAAIDAIAEHGLDAVKLRDIGRRAGVSTGAVTHYFESKDDVLLAAIGEVCDRLLDRVEAPVRGDPIAAMAEALPIDARSRREWKVWVAFWGRAAFDPSLAEVHRGYYARIEMGLARAIGGDAARACAIAAAIIAAIDGIGIRATLEPELWPPSRQRELLRTLVAPLLRTTPPETKHA